nr:MAG TPA: hypothetical protein [Caudoviricetes sp.]
MVRRPYLARCRGRTRRSCCGRSSRFARFACPINGSMR